MKHNNTHRFSVLTPLDKLPLLLRVVVSLLPTVLVLAFRPWFPKVLSQTPAVMFYPVALLAAWWGGLVPGIISTVLCSIYSLLFLRPHLLNSPFDDIPGLVRTIMFFTTSIFFSVLIAGFQKALKRTKAALEIRNEFLSLASHELRTPLNILNLQVHLIEDDVLNPSENLNEKELRDSFEVAKRQVSELERLVSNTLELEYLEEGKLSVRKEQMDLMLFLEKLKRDFTRQASKANCEISLTGPESLFGWWDKHRLTQIFSNLFSNAIKYAAGKPIRVSVTQVVGAVEVSVADEGMGIKPEELKSLFKKYFRGVSYLNYPGLGIGLYMALMSAEAHAGTIRVTSELGKGTTFTVVLPLNV